VEFDVETLKPTYRLLIGIPGKSNAFLISRRLGLPDYIIEEAKENIATESMRFEDLIQSLQEKSIKAQDDAREAESIKLQAMKLKEKYEEKLYNLQNAREKSLMDAQRDAKRVIKEAKEEADAILKNMREMERLGYSSEARQKLEQERLKLKERLDRAESAAIGEKEHRGEKLQNVKEGQEVFIPSLNQKVIVLSKPDSKGEVLVQAGIMKISVKLEELRASKETAESTKKRSSRTVNLNLKAVSTSIDLRGMDAEEALFKTDKYLDEAYMGGLSEVTIIHGKGTGVLRNSISDMLKRHPHVKKYRLGEYGEGGTGVTVAELK
jgi:DNA mismatch repair protein MutS2